MKKLAEKEFLGIIYQLKRALGRPDEKNAEIIIPAEYLEPFDVMRAWKYQKGYVKKKTGLSSHDYYAWVKVDGNNELCLINEIDDIGVILLYKYPVMIRSKQAIGGEILIDNKTLHNFVKENKYPLIIWHRMCLDHYEGKKSEEYKQVAVLYEKWFDYWDIKIDSKEDEQPEKEAGKETQKIPNKWHRDKITNLTFTGEKYIELNTLTDEHIIKNGGSVNKSVIIVYNENKKTVFKDVNYGKGWQDDSLNGYYYKGGKLKKT